MRDFLQYFNLAVWGFLFLFTAVKFMRCIRLVPNRKEYIVERLGRYNRTLGAGFHVLIPFIDRVTYMRDLREETIEVPPQECFTSDNVNVEVDGVIYISVTNSKNACYGVTDYRVAAVSLAQTTTRSVIGTLELDRTFEERDAINSRVVSVLSEVASAWGVRVHRYEVKNIVPPPSVRDAMERQMAAERERRALLARAEGEKQARVNRADGRRMELINRSEGEMRRRINEAEGRAAEIHALAKATADSITFLAQALSRPGGAEAMRLQLSQQYLTRLGQLARPTNSVLLPLDLSRPDQLFEALPMGDGQATERATDVSPAALPTQRVWVSSPTSAPVAVAAPLASGSALDSGPGAAPPVSGPPISRRIVRDPDVREPSPPRSR